MKTPSQLPPSSTPSPESLRLRWLVRTVAASTPHPLSSSLPRQIFSSNPRHVGSLPSSPIQVSDSEHDNFPAFPPLPSKRKRAESRPDPDTSDSDSDVVVKKKAMGKKARKAPKHTGDEELQVITRHIRTDIEQDFAYRVDLTNDPREWLDSKDRVLSTAAIIKSEACDQDSWGKGSASSIQKPTKVLALNGALCQVAKHDCQGIYVCDQLDEDQLRGHERYEPDDNEMFISTFRVANPDSPLPVSATTIVFHI
ncbi:hypothetical protein C8F04DRAFT_1309884 [Mycena alexandri]|uniref:Uncharacterized protein n=1 Tax=Mycena alexandri TaxID=1745969 RepID=A0AAD6S835_9AGAR|nr:hypothetical protein C8F04DRAFT_1309884 [Mycena alexandri]